jgi:hypothetical protein
MPGLQSQTVSSGADEAGAVEREAVLEAVEAGAVEADADADADAGAGDCAGDCAAEPHPANVRTMASASGAIGPLIGRL